MITYECKQVLPYKTATVLTVPIRNMLFVQVFVLRCYYSLIANYILVAYSFMLR